MKNEIPEKCIKCINHKKTEKGSDYCEYKEYDTDIGTPVPYPYFFKQEYPCKGHKKKMGRKTST